MHLLYLSGLNIVFVWSQYDGGNINKEQWLRFPPKPNEAKLNTMRRRLSLDPNIQHLDPIIHYIIPVMFHNKSVLY